MRLPPSGPKIWSNEPIRSAAPIGTYAWEANWERVIENGLDFAHAPFVHGSAFGAPDRPEIDAVNVNADAWSGHARLVMRRPVRKGWRCRTPTATMSTWSRKRASTPGAGGERLERAGGGAGEPRGHGDCLPDAAHGEHVGAGGGPGPRGAANRRQSPRTPGPCRTEHRRRSVRCAAPNVRLPVRSRVRDDSAQWRGVTGSTAAQYGSAP
ncbi:hypothetical protein AB4Y44_19745 [Paraburkholderia sp. BR10937]|uniref:hypothetical protein n=1 Tax=Paraburkholderia sp. BR10937 TaxID=3236994 RepID=UPI0034D19E0E